MKWKTRLKRIRKIKTREKKIRRQRVGKKIQMPHFEMHFEMHALSQVPLQAERGALFMINGFN